MATYLDYLNALKNNTIVPCYRITILDESENPRYEITDDILSGSLSISQNSGVRRSGTVVLSNKDGKYDNLSFGVKIKIDAGIEISATETYYIPQGIFYISKITPLKSASQNQLTLTLVDKWGALDGTVGGKTPYKIQYLKTITSYRTSGTQFNGLNIDASAMRGTDFIFPDSGSIIFTDATEQEGIKFSVNNKLKYTGNGIESSIISTFKTRDFGISFKPNFLMGVQEIGDFISFIFKSEDSATLFSIKLEKEENDKNKITLRLKYLDNENKTIDKTEIYILENDVLVGENVTISFKLNNNSIGIYFGNKSFLFKFYNNRDLDFSITFKGSRELTFTDLIFSGSFLTYYEYNMYDIIRSTLLKSKRYDVRIIDYIPMGEDYDDCDPTTDEGRVKINQLLTERLLGGLSSITINDYIQFISNQKIYKCQEEGNTVDTLKWELFTGEYEMTIDKSVPILDTYYEPKYITEEGVEYVDVYGTKYLKSYQPYGLLTLPSSIKQERGQTEGAVLAKIAELLSAEVGYNRYGNFFLRPTIEQTNYQTKEIVWRFKKEDYLYSKQQTYDFSKIVNYVIATASVINGTDISEIAMNKDYASDFCVQKIGVMPYVYQLGYSYNTNEWKIIEDGVEKIDYKAIRQNLKELAEWHLKRHMRLLTSFAITCPYMPHIEEGKIIELENDDGTYRRCEINSFTLPLDFQGTMSINLSEVVDNYE